MRLNTKICFVLMGYILIQIASSRVLQSTATSGSITKPKIDIGGANLPNAAPEVPIKPVGGGVGVATSPGTAPPFRLSGKERWIYAGVWAILGLPIAMYGLRFWIIFGWLVGGLAGLNLGNYLETQVQSNFTYNNTWSWVMLVVTCALAIAGAFIFACCKGCVASIMGGYIGFICSNAVISGIASANNGASLEWWAQQIIWVTCIGVGVIIGCCLKDYMVLIGTAIVGGWTFIAGVGTFVGQFPYVYTLGTAAWIWWSWFAGAVTLMVFGTIWQSCDKVNKENKKNNNSISA